MVAQSSDGASLIDIDTVPNCCIGAEVLPPLEVEFPPQPTSVASSALHAA